MVARCDLLRVNPDGIPEQLKVRPQWVTWKLQERNGDLTKVPYTPFTDRKASSIDLLTWKAFEEALATFRQGGYDGIGFVFSSADPYCGIDLDGCRNPATGELAAWAEEIVANLDGYGEGVHVIVRGKVPNRRKGRIEVYSFEWFVTMSGQAL